MSGNESTRRRASYHSADRTMRSVFGRAEAREFGLIRLEQELTS